MKIAIIFTSFNRAKKTENCIRKLLQQQTKYPVDMDFFICDDNSGDDTVSIVQELIPNAHIIYGTGNLYWSKGMHLAMQMAFEEKSDLYLMINDDVDFYETAIEIMLDNYFHAKKDSGIVGSVKDKIENVISYGGRNFIRKIKIGKNTLLEPNGKLQLCDLANWNCFLLPHSVLADVGLIDPYFEHGLGDFDYSLQMKKKGYGIYVADRYVGTCSRNLLLNTSQDKSLSKIKRIKRLFSIKENPIRSSFYFYKKNYGLFGVAYFFWLYFHNLLTILIK